LRRATRQERPPQPVHRFGRRPLLNRTELSL
jgi:hypothetical protein